MTIQAWIALAGIAVTLIIVIGGALITHAMKDERDKGEMRTEIANLKQQVGTRETGLTGSLHKQGNMIARIQGGLMFIADKLKISIRREGDE